MVEDSLTVAVCLQNCRHNCTLHQHARRVRVADLTTAHAEGLLTVLEIEHRVAQLAATLTEK